MDTRLTTLERKALNHAFKSARGNGHDFGFIEEIVKGMRPLKAQAVGALVVSLQKKGVIEVHDPITTDSGTWTQFTWEIPIPEVVKLTEAS